MKDEYARVGVPMMPVVRGEDETRRQILLYTVLLLVLTLLPFAFGCSALLYAVAARRPRRRVHRARAVRLQRRADRRSALRTYLFSLGYLAAAVLRDGRGRPALARYDSPPAMDKTPRPQEPPHRADRRASIMLFMFALTFVAALVYTA